MKDAATSPLSFLAHVGRLPDKGLPVHIHADERQCAALAAAHGLLAVEGFRADLLVKRWKRHGVEVAGTVEADIVQACVVTLEPLAAHISEPVSALFLPAESKLGREGFGAGGEILIDAEGPDAPELFNGDTIDVGGLAEEFFELAIDPYPRKEGADYAVPDDPDRPESPFAGLAELKKR